ncbi:BTB/POZ protein [Penicillium frequentans]|nr:BTB/POZ protein [Penicillium glabrum]
MPTDPPMETELPEEKTGQIQKDGVGDGTNPGQVVGDMTASIQSFFQSAQFSDLVIKTEEQEFKVHRLIVCGQSEYFARLYKANWTETTENMIHLKDDDPRAIEAMIHFMYGFDYDSSGNDFSRVSPMLFNIKVYQVADKYFVPQLKQRAKDKFGQIARTCWQMDDFPVAIAEAYQCTQKNDRDLRELLVKISQDHIAELTENEKFCSILQETIGFAADLTLSLCRERALTKDHHKYYCSTCSENWTSSSPEGTRYCPFCGRSGVVRPASP